MLEEKATSIKKMENIWKLTGQTPSVYENRPSQDIERVKHYHAEVASMLTALVSEPNFFIENIGSSVRVFWQKSAEKARVLLKDKKEFLKKTFPISETEMFQTFETFVLHQCFDEIFDIKGDDTKLFNCMVKLRGSILLMRNRPQFFGKIGDRATLVARDMRELLVNQPLGNEYIIFPGIESEGVIRCKALVVCL